MIKKTKTMIKVGIAILATAIILLGIGAIYIHHNLSTYFIYYAKHIPHAEGTNPEMVFILDHLDSMGESNIEGLRYDTDGHNSIIKDSSYILRQSYGDDKMGYEVGFLQGYNSEYYRTYQFDKSGKFYSYYYQKADVWKDVYDKSDTRKQEAQGYVDEVINPIVKKLEVKPKVNLQWWFNKKYQERFN
ncbi:hypothetical protein [Streptococcus gallolyticus]|uniref:hypothetical protein n=1 Tax=Streptococcus gallolyticus TaxID=315405 RepID=UPI0008897D2A|nr:hypothetical protein [Streptococcus gallolyticus]SDJ60017.1 hypothetical protein SAMN04487842_0205 [Streptococcus gallolyticus]SDL08495.1 hypothetical protein SAMN04487841_0205 [Streptococcus gallolyticus]